MMDEGFVMITLMYELERYLRRNTTHFVGIRPDVILL